MAYTLIYEASPFSKKYEEATECQSVVDCERQKYSVLWAAESSGESYSDTIDDSYLFSINLKAKVKYKLLDQLKFVGQMNLNFRNGRVQSRFGDFIPNGVFLGYGYFDWDVLDNEVLNLSAGALRQDLFFNPVFMANRSFPGVGQRIKLYDSSDSLNKFNIQFAAQQTIPTSYSFNTELIEKESLPSLLSAQVYANYETTLFDVKATAGFFSFSDLPSKVANYSRFTGNSIIGTDATSQFIFDFQGWMAGLTFMYKPNAGTSIALGIDMLENLEAPDTFNQSQRLRLVASKRINKDIGVILGVGNYFVESDAVPSYYTSTQYGNTNRKGNFIELGIEWIPQKFKITASYNQADLINSDTDGRQYNADFIFINLETAYDNIF